MAEEVKLLVNTSGTSPYAMRVQVALAVKGIKYEKVEENLLNKSQLLLESNPIHKKIPVLIHNGKPVVESVAIVQYIDETWPSPDGKDLLPKDPYERAVARFWAAYTDKLFADVLIPILKTTGEEQKKAIEESLQCLTNLEGALGAVSKKDPFFGGASVGYMDVILAPLVVWYRGIESVGDFKIPFEEKFTRLCAWMKAMEESTYIQCLLEPEKVTEFIHAIRKKFVPS